MTPPAPTRSDRFRSPDKDRLPWPSLLVLGAATLVMVTAEMLPTAVLGPMSDGLGVAQPRIAQLVSVWAAVVMVASFPLVRLVRGRDRRRVILVGLLSLTLSSVLTAAAPTYGAVLGARLLGALAVGLLWATVNAHVASLVSDRLLGPAVAIVLGGATLGMVVGTPLARLLADLAGWRVAFVALAAAGLVTAILVRSAVAQAVQHSAPPADGPRALAAGSMGPMLVVTGLVALVLAGHYAAYTFITRLAALPAGALPGQMSSLLLGFGVASALGVAIAGRLGARTTSSLVVSVGLTSVALLALKVADANATLGLAVILTWGVVSGAIPPLAQTAILRLAGAAHRSMAGALIPVLFNGAIALGAGLSALLVERNGVFALPVPAAVVVAAATVGLAISSRARRAGSQEVIGGGPSSLRHQLGETCGNR